MEYMKMTTVQADRADRPDDLVASGDVVNLRFPPGKKALSLRAAKVFHLIVKNAGANLAVPWKHKIALNDLRVIANMTNAGIGELIYELQSTIVVITSATEVVTGPLLEYVGRQVVDNGHMSYRFSEPMRTIFANSTYWAVIQQRAVLAFESRYGLRLFELISLRINMAHKTSEVFDLEVLREHLGVPADRLTRWDHFRSTALEPALEEVNRIAKFIVAAEPVKHARAVTGVKLSWKPHAGKQAAQIEVPAGFPASGSISYSKWGTIVAALCKAPTPDMDRVANAFRQWSASKGMRLDAPNVETTFSGFCKRFSS